ncbi:GIY-YIG nuclease family protein [Rhodococcus sp. NPDC003994]
MALSIGRTPLHESSRRLGHGSIESVIDIRTGYLRAPIYTRADVLASPCPVPTSRGVYGWWFDKPPSDSIDTTNCQKRDGLTLLYTGISPSKPPTNGKAPSKENIRKRIKYHYQGNAAGSTLRLTLGCLLGREHGIALRRVGASGSRLHFHSDEALIDRWMDQHAFVSWVEHTEPWELEDHLIDTLDLPLNLQGNKHNHFYATLAKCRADARRHAFLSPVLNNPGKRAKLGQFGPEL